MHIEVLVVFNVDIFKDFIVMDNLTNIFFKARIPYSEIFKSQMTVWILVFV